MKGILTPEDKQYLRRVTNYLSSLGMQDGNIEIDIDNGYTFDYNDVEWEFITNFTNNYSSEIPPGLIPILQKIMKYCGDNNIIKEHDDDVNYQRLEFDIDVDNKQIIFSHWWSYYDTGDSSSVEYDSEEDIQRFDGWLSENLIDVPSNGVLTLTYNGSGDSGYIEGSFEESGESVPSVIEDWCYGELSRNFGGWEINEGSDGNFIFDFNTKKVTLNHTENIEANDSDTYFEESFVK